MTALQARTSPTIADPAPSQAPQVVPNGLDRMQALSDEEREEAIVRAGVAVQKHMREWAESGCFAARGNADRALKSMEALIRGRSPEQVARMERERGLA